METKKNAKADLERQWGRRFLLALVVVLAFFTVALEWNFGEDGDDEADSELLESMEKEIDFSQLKKNDEMVAMRASRKAAQKADKIKVVQEEVEQEVKPAPSAKSEEPNEDSQLAETGGKAEEDESANEFNTADNPLQVRVVESLPEFPGGAVALMKWLTKNLRYPYSAQKDKIQGKVIVEFIVQADGKLTDRKINKKYSPELDKEALRVLNMMPDWKPGTDKGKPCRTKVVIPIVFKL